VNSVQLSTEEKLSNHLSHLVALKENLDEAIGQPHEAETPAEMHVRLIRTRATMTSVAAVLGSLVQLRTGAKVALDAAAGDLEDAEVATVGSQIKMTEDYSSAKEKNARLGAATIEQRLAQRRAQKNLTMVTGVYDYAMVYHRELDRAVRDVETRIRIITLEGRFD
jgi:hypothetical protein